MSPGAAAVQSVEFNGNRLAMFGNNPYLGVIPRIFKASDRNSPFGSTWR